VIIWKIEREKRKKNPSRSLRELTGVDACIRRRGPPDGSEKEFILGVRRRGGEGMVRDAKEPFTHPQGEGRGTPQGPALPPKGGQKGRNQKRTSKGRGERPSHWRNQFLKRLVRCWRGEGKRNRGRVSCALGKKKVLRLIMRKDNRRSIQKQKKARHFFRPKGTAVLGSKVASRERCELLL